MLGSDRPFFPRLDETDETEAVVQSHVDRCFELALAYHQDPDVFLSKPLDDLGFYVEQTNLANARMNKA